ncbi:hypothetical protein LCGC14_0975690 [marine sediment metagenome]|uniref:Uncharacterized protein n=1 Tax=marine sediment metagenome TaxID=412755 RepID=A0A0F9NA84_9ZZZZ
MSEARRLLRLVGIAGCSHYEGQAPNCPYSTAPLTWPSP